jgi:hypothetical protein
MKFEHFVRHCRITVKTWLFRFGEWLKDDGSSQNKGKGASGKNNEKKKK